MTQRARPNADVSSGGGWGFTPSPPTTFFSHLNELTHDDATYVTSPSGGGWFKVQLSASAVPVDGPQSLTVRVRGSAANTPVGVALLQGDTVIAYNSSFTVGTTFTPPLVLKLTDDQQALITDYADLRVLVYDDLVSTSGCPDHRYRKRLKGTWGASTGSCGCFSGTFDLDWNGTNWVGVFGGCSADVTVTLGLADIWTVAFSSTSYSFGAIAVPIAECGEPPPASGVIATVGGGCDGSVSLGFSAF